MIENIEYTKIKVNPTNPRIIKNDKFKKLVQSIKEFPEMLEKRPLVLNKDLVILGGNMRFKACVDAGIKEIPCIITDWDEKKQREFIIKDNLSMGEWDWDMLANEWDKDQLEEWGMTLLKPKFDLEYSQKIGKVTYDPKESNHEIKDLYKVEADFEEDISKIENEEMRKMLRYRASNFVKFEFSKIADYYAYQASEEEQRIFEKMALVLLDRDQLIEHGFSKLITSIIDEKESTEED